MDCTGFNYNVAPNEVVIDHGLIITKYKRNKRALKSPELLVDDFERLMNLFPTEHPANIHGIMIKCDQNFNEAVSMLQYVTELRNTLPKQESALEKVNIQEDLRISQQQYRDKNIIYDIQYGITQLGKELINETDNSSAANTKPDFVEMLPKTKYRRH